MNVEEKIKSILCELSGERTVENGSSLQGDLALDSLSMIIMIVELEEAFDIELNESDMNPYELGTVQHVIDMINKYVGDEDEKI